MAYAPGIFTGEFIDAAVNNIPTAFSSAAGSAITGLRAYAHASFSHLQIINTSTSMIGLVTANVDDGVPLATAKRARCPGNNTITFDAAKGKTLILDNLYIQSESGSVITSGTVIVNMW